MKKVVISVVVLFALLFYDQFLDLPPDTAVLYPGMTDEEIAARADSLVHAYYEDNISRIDSLFNRIIRDRAPGAAVMVIQDGSILYKKGFGLANLSSGESIQPDTKFMLASMSKQFTAMAVMILAEEGKLSYDDTLPKYFSGIPPGWKTITVRHLLTHTSGIPDRFYLIGYAEGYTNQDILERLIQHRYLDFMPGARHKYSNSGYNLLAMIVEKISNQPFRDFLKDRIFEPLEMNDTVVYDETQPDINNRAVAYWPTRRGYRQNDFLLYTTGSSGIFSSLEDLYKWDQSLYTDQLVSAETLEEAFSPLVRAGRNEYYGFGWRIARKGTAKAVYHTGTLGGSHNIIFRLPEEGFTVILLSNTRMRSRRRLVRAISEFYHPGLMESIPF